MGNVILSLVFLGSFVVTSYRSIPSQTDSTPYITATGYYVHPYGVAVHPSLLCARAKYRVGKEIKLCRRGLGCKDQSRLHYGDVIFIETIGIKIVNDCMDWGKWDAKHQRWITNMNSRFDIWVANPELEVAHHKRYGSKRLHIWLVKPIPEEK